MLFCCLWRHWDFLSYTSSLFPAINKIGRLLPAISVTTCGTVVLRRRVLVLITAGRLQRWNHAVKPAIGSESRFLPTPPAFDAPVREVPVGIVPCCLVRNHRIAWLHNSKTFLKIYLFLLTECTNVTHGRTDRHTRLRPRLHSISRQKKLRLRYCTIEAMKLTTDRYEASSGLFATAELLVNFPIDFCMALTTVQRQCAACDYVYWLHGPLFQRHCVC